MNKKEKEKERLTKKQILNKSIFFKTKFALIYFILFASLKHFFLDNTLGFFPHPNVDFQRRENSARCSHLELS